MPNPRLWDSREAGAGLLAGSLWLRGGISPLAAPSLQHRLRTHAPVLGKLRQQLPPCRGCRWGEVPVSLWEHGPAGALHQLLRWDQAELPCQLCGEGRGREGPREEFTACKTNRAAFA